VGLSHTISAEALGNLDGAIITVMGRLYSLKCHSLGLQVQNNVAREVLPTKVSRGLYQTLGED
jgi:hypothetical protein